MQGIILTGGQGSRLAPLTDNKNKHLIDICGRPMINYSLSLLLSAGVSDVTLVTNPNHLDDFKKELSIGLGTQFDPLRFIPQKDKPGIAGSILMMPPDIRSGPYMVVLGDNIVGGSLKFLRDKFEADPNRALIVLSEVLVPTAFGVARLENGKLVDIEEKPEKARSRWVITGIYFFPNDLFEIAETIEPSGRGEYEVTDILTVYLKQDRLDYHILKEWWVDAGTHESLERARQLIGCGGTGAGETADNNDATNKNNK